MDREHVRQLIKKRIKCKDFLEKAKHGGYICPICKSGSGKHQTGAVKIYDDTNSWYCHACKQGGDIITLYKLQTNQSYNEVLSILANNLGVAIDNSNHFFKSNKNLNKNKAFSKPENFTEYYLECQNRIKEPDATNYLSKRGISVETAEAYGIGYDPKADTAQTGYKTPRLIIPTSKTHYVARRIDNENKFKVLNPKNSTPHIFNNNVLYKPEVTEIFVTEGIFDCLSFLEAGYSAIALNSTVNVDILINMLKKKRTDATLILCLDNDQAGINATIKLREFLQSNNLSFLTANFCDKGKDPNDMWVENKEKFQDEVAKLLIKSSPKPDSLLNYIMTGIFEEDIKNFKSDIKTGFKILDEKSGGIFSGLYLLAAGTSLGKTTFLTQLADNIAESGHDVIFFSLEQSRLELLTKSLSRQMQKLNLNSSLSAINIRKNHDITPDMYDSIGEYIKKTDDRISVVEANFDANIEYIGNYVKKYIARNNTRPVVIIDYLQILRPTDYRQSTKETIDNIATELARMKRELNIPIIAASSINRASYKDSPDISSLKESGLLEFSADVVFTLQLQCMKKDAYLNASPADKKKMIMEEKNRKIRAMELECHKNRYGKPCFSCYFNYDTEHDLFIETNPTSLQ